MQNCLPGNPVLCGDQNVCTAETCNPDGGCESTPLDCDDADPCTLDSCHPLAGCEHRVDPAAGIAEARSLAGRSLGAFPHFDYVNAFNEGDTIEVALDPSLDAGLVGQTCDLFVTDNQTAGSWCAAGALTDVRGAPQEITFVPGSVTDNTFVLAGGGTLSSDAGTEPGRGYDLVLDCDRDGQLDPGERVDGLGDAAGFYVFGDLSAAGPLAVSSFDVIGPEPDHCSGGGNDDMRIYYPTLLDDPEAVEVYPLVVVSHGNGHCFDWYDFLGNHLASYGYIVMSHDNDTVPGIETASETTLIFTDRILEEQGEIGGGVLAGHIDSSRISWIGHSRGGEGIVRAYDRLVDEAYPSRAYSADDLVVLSSIAPTDFLGPDQTDPKGVAYHLLYGASDGDVCGCPNNSIAQSFPLFERATGARKSTYVHGADHNDFNCCGFDDFSGPAGTAVGRPEAQQVQKAATLALLEVHVKQRRAPEEWFWRHYETLRPLGVAATTTVVHDERVHPELRGGVIDDFQSESSINTSSSGGSVTFNVANASEERQTDVDSSFDWTGSQPMNGMTRGRGNDTGRGLVFDYSFGTTAFLEFEVVAGSRDWSRSQFLSFRAAQGTRHPETMAELADLDFSVTLFDGSGGQSTVQIGSYGGGIEEPYQREGFGDDAGWQNEFEIIRLPLEDFQRDGTALDLEDIRAVRFDFGTGNGSDQGRVGFDTLELIKE